MATRIELPKTPNFAISRLATGLSAGATTVSLESNASFPDPSGATAYHAVIFDEDFSHPALDPNVEIVKVTNKSGPNLTIQRGQEGTSDVAHSTPGQTYLMFATVTEFLIQAIRDFLFEPDIGNNAALTDRRVSIVGGGSSTPVFTHRFNVSNHSSSVAKFERQGTTGTIVQFSFDGNNKGQIVLQGDGETITYEAFSGGHMTQLMEAQAEPPMCAVVVMAGSFLPGPFARFPHVTSTTSAGDPKVYGVWAGKSDDAQSRAFGDETKALYGVSGLGLNRALVTDTNGDIAQGDLLETSTRAWHGQKQTGGAIANSTLGKALAAVTWSSESVDPTYGFKSKLIPVLLYSG